MMKYRTNETWESHVSSSEEEVSIVAVVDIEELLTVNAHGFLF